MRRATIRLTVPLPAPDGPSMVRTVAISVITWWWGLAMKLLFYALGGPPGPTTANNILVPRNAGPVEWRA